MYNVNDSEHNTCAASMASGTFCTCSLQRCSSSSWGEIHIKCQACRHGRIQQQDIHLVSRRRCSRAHSPPMRSACASPAVVTHEGLIVVVHGEGADSGVEALNTSIPNPEWKQVEPLPYFSATPSATIVNGYLVVWIGTVYCMHLSCITADRRNTCRLPSNWMALPSPPESISLQLTSYKDQLAAFIISTDRQVFGYQFDQFHREWIKCCALDTVSTALSNQQIY